jgi:hypothetical protein
VAVFGNLLKHPENAHHKAFQPKNFKQNCRKQEKLPLFDITIKPLVYAPLLTT